MGDRQVPEHAVAAQHDGDDDERQAEQGDQRLERAGDEPLDLRVELDQQQEVLFEGEHRIAGPVGDGGGEQRADEEDEGAQDVHR